MAIQKQPKTLFVWSQSWGTKQPSASLQRVMPSLSFNSLALQLIHINREELTCVLWMPGTLFQPILPPQRCKYVLGESLECVFLAITGSVRSRICGCILYLRHCRTNKLSTNTNLGFNQLIKFEYQLFQGTICASCLNLFKIKAI